MIARTTTGAALQTACGIQDVFLAKHESQFESKAREGKDSAM